MVADPRFVPIISAVVRAHDKALIAAGSTLIQSIDKEAVEIHALAKATYNDIWSNQFTLLVNEHGFGPVRHSCILLRINHPEQ